MKISLTNLRVKNLRVFNYSDTLATIDELENVKPFEFEEIPAIEAVEDYLGYIKIINDRITNNEFRELQNENKVQEKQILLERLARLAAIFRLSFNINNFLKRQSAEFQIRENEIKNYVLTEEKELKKKIEDGQEKISNTVQTVKEETAQIERKSLAHNMSIMGIFAAIITIIMSVVVTSSSWLNSADGISSIMAFVVPALVVLLSVFVLISLIYCYNNFFVFKARRNAASIIFFSVVLMIIVALAVLVGVIFVNQSKQDPHIRHIISKAEYHIVSDQENEEIKYFEFNLDDCNYRFVYDESLLHENEYLYYCKEHSCLE